MFPVSFVLGAKQLAPLNAQFFDFVARSRFFGNRRDLCGPGVPRPLPAPVVVLPEDRLVSPGLAGESDEEEEHE